MASAAAQQQPADLIVTNAKVVTVDTQRRQAPAFAVEDGTFVAVGDDAEIAPHRSEKTRVIDACGHIVTPGLNDSHTHIVRGGVFYNLELRWDDVDSLEGARPGHDPRTGPLLVGFGQDGR